MLLALVLAGCGHGLDQVTVEVEGLSRSYYLHPPADPEATLPVVFVFHGGSIGGYHNGRHMSRFTGFSDLADDEGFLAVYPNSWGGNWDDGRGVGTSFQEGIDDMAYVDAVLDDLRTRFTVDAARTYTTGMSNGGFFSARLACERADVFAAFAPVVATLGADLASTCAPSRPVGALYIPGTDDPLVPWDGGVVGNDRGDALSVDDSMAFWAAANGCAQPVESDLHDLEDDGTTAFRRTFTACAGGVSTELIGVEGGGHTWPGGRQYLPKGLIGATSGDFAAEEEIWRFFAAHTLQ